MLDSFSGLDVSRPREDPPPTIKSLESREQTWIRFKNNTGRPVQLVWLNYDGKPETYTIVEAGKEHRQHTFKTHPWQFVDADTREKLVVDRKLVVFPSTEETTAVIETVKNLEWSHASHCRFPAPFREAVKKLLLCHHRIQSSSLAEADLAHRSKQDPKSELGYLIGQLDMHLLDEIIRKMAPTDIPDILPLHTANLRRHPYFSRVAIPPFREGRFRLFPRPMHPNRHPRIAFLPPRELLPRTVATRCAAGICSMSHTRWALNGFAAASTFEAYHCSGWCFSEACQELTFVLAVNAVAHRAFDTSGTGHNVGLEMQQYRTFSPHVNWAR
eukprot:jgi/Mesvir1/28276/Mv04800-RA.1